MHNMQKITKVYLLILAVVLILVCSFYFLFIKKEEVAQKIDTSKLSLLDSYLYENLKVTLNLDSATEQNLMMFCDKKIATTPTQAIKVGIPCVNPNPIHKTIIGWATDDQKYIPIMEAVGNQQLAWRRKVTSETGNLLCEEKPEFLQYQDVDLGLGCIMTLESGEKIYSSAAFIKSSDKNKKVFIVVMNLLTSTSIDKTDKELLTLLKKKLVSLSKSYSKNSFITKAYAGGGGSEGGGAGTCSAADMAGATTNSGCSTGPTGGDSSGADQVICDVSNPASCYVLYCASPTAHWDFATNACVEGVVSADLESDVAISFTESPATANPVNLEITANSNTSQYGTAGPILTWSATGATNCTASGGWSGSLPTSGEPARQVSYANNTAANVPVDYAITCKNGKHAKKKVMKVHYLKNAPVYVPPATGNNDGQVGCFIAGTKVTMGDGTKKNIEDVTFEDTLMTSKGPEQVMRRYVIPYKGLVYAFNGDGNYFVTPTHPFMTTGGWKSLDPEGTRRESPGIQVSKLSVGDILVTTNGSKKILTHLDSKYMTTTVYNFGVNGTHDFYADDYLVHNVDMSYIPFQRAYAESQK